MTDIQIDSQSFFSKLQKINKTWNQTFTNIGAIALVMGKVKDEPERPLTSDFFLWLLNWEFSDTLVIMTRSKTVFAVSPKKAKLLRDMKVPDDYQGPKLVIIEQNPKVETPHQIVDKVMQEVAASDLEQVATWTKDKPDGDLTKAAFEALSSSKIVDLKDLADSFNKVKTATEIRNQKVAASFTEWTFSRVIDEIEEIIEDKKQVKHSQIQKRIEACLDNESVMATFKTSCDSQFLDFPLPVLIQSGGDFSINKFQVDSSNEKLDSQAIYINVCGKYCDMSAMASRTLIVNPRDEQKAAYILAHEAEELLISNLKPGQKISDAYNSAKQFVSEKNPNVVMGSNFGFGIGFLFKEDALTINGANHTVVQEGMTFHVRIALQNVHKEAARSVVAIGDTVIVTAEGAQVITSKIQKKYKEISYSLEDSDEEPAPPKKSKPVPAPKHQKKQNQSEEESYGDEEEDSKEVLVQGRTGATVIKSTRLRSKANEQKQKLNDLEERKTHQAELYEEKQKELKIRFQRGEISSTAKKEKVKKMDTLQAFKGVDQYPKDIVPGQIYVDMKRNAVLIPNSPTSFIPFHVSCIKSVSDMIQGQWTFLRINFQTAPTTSMHYPPMDDPNNLWIKELTMKTKSSTANNRLSQASKQIKECLKQVKQQETESEVKAAQGEKELEQLQLLKTSRKEQLDNLVIRPNLEGKKTLGNLEIHTNGLRFVSQKGAKVDICFSNIKHCFFQPCASDELIVLLHFNLITPIMLGNKKVSDVQFYKESGVAAEDINFTGGRSKFNDMDELEQEEAERQARSRLNTKFLNYAKLVEQASSNNKSPIEVDIPEEDLQFYGCPMKTVVRIRPTKECLVALSEFPFFVLDINDIEIVCFERVFFGIKNFDCVIVYKDFMTFKRIDSVPIEHLEELKSYFDSIDVMFAESAMPLKWKDVLQSMRDNFQDNLDAGVWRDLVVEGSDDEEGEDSADVDSDAQYGEEDAESDDDSVVSGGDDDYSDSSDVASNEELSEEGLSWDELDKVAEEEDKRNAARRVPERGPNQGKGGRKR